MRGAPTAMFLFLLGCEPAAPPVLAGGAVSAQPTAAAPEVGAAPASGVAVYKRSPAIGDRFRCTHRLADHRKTDLSSPSATLRRSHDSEDTVERVDECLAITDNRCTRLQLSYSNVRTTTTEDGGQPTISTSVINARTYVVSLEGAEVIVTVDGKPPTEGERSAVMDDYAGLRRRRRLLDVVPSVLTVGQELESFRYYAESLLGKEKGENPIASMRVRSIDGAFEKQRIVVDLSISTEHGGGDKGRTKTQWQSTVTLTGSGTVSYDLTGDMTIMYDGNNSKKAKGSIGGPVEAYEHCTRL